MALVLVAIGLFRWWSSGVGTALPWLLAGCVVVLLGLVVPGALFLPTRAWRWVFGGLGRIQSTLFFLLVFVLLVIPIGMVRKRADHLRMAAFRVEESGWVDRSDGFNSPDRLY